jgi:hypothetical protein
MPGNPGFNEPELPLFPVRQPTRAKHNAKISKRAAGFRGQDPGPGAGGRVNFPPALAAAISASAGCLLMTQSGLRLTIRVNFTRRVPCLTVP